MNKIFYKVFIIGLISIVISSCKKDDIAEAEPLRDYAVQYQADLDSIENYLKTHYIETVVNNPGQQTDQDITITKIPTNGTQVSIWDQTVYPLQSINVEEHDITYKVYYLQLRQGSGATSKSPCNVDAVLTAYKGQLLNGTVFDFNDFPNSFFSLTSVIRGWSEIFPKFKTGSYVGNPDGTISYSDFGAGVMFVPSGLAYYSTATANIPSYNPLIFSFKLYEVQRIDNDGDGVYSYLEDIGSTTALTTPDGYIRDNETTYEDDTDKDGIPNAIDTDDDGDSYLTIGEIHKNADGTIIFEDTDGDGIANYLDKDNHE